MAASVTDFIQSIIMTIALIAVVCFGLSTVDGLQTVSTYSTSLDGYISLLSTYDFDTASRVSYGGIITIISTMAWGLGYFGMPHILLRFMAIEKPEKIKLSRRISTVWVFIAMGVAIFIGVMARTMVSKGALAELQDPERAIIVIAQTLAEHSFIASLLAGVILAGILACTMSTCDSQMLAASSSVSENIIHETFGIELSEHMQMVMARVVLVIIAAIGVIIARDPNSSVFGIVSFAWAGFGAAFGPIMLLALFWKRANRYGAIAGMLGGGVMIFVWKFLIKPLGGVFGIYELLPAFIVALILCVVVSLATEAPSKEIVEEFESIK
jgi:sodium/proline symporter